MSYFLNLFRSLNNSKGRGMCPSGSQLAVRKSRLAATHYQAPSLHLPTGPSTLGLYMCLLGRRLVSHPQPHMLPGAGEDASQLEHPISAL